MVGTVSQKTVMMGNVSVGKTTNAFPLDISGSVNFTGTLYQNGSAYTQTMPTDISCNNLTVATNMFYGANRFRYVPWTSIGTTIGNVLTAIVATTTAGGGTVGSMPSFNTTGTTVKYCYSVIGNTMYIDFTYYSTGSSGGLGTGKYIYLIPSGYTANTTFAMPYALSSSQTTPSGTLIGSSSFLLTGSWFYGGQVWLVQHSTTSIGIGINVLNNALSGSDNIIGYSLSANPVNFTFSCSFPIN
jgi:hypothetical protein